MNWLDELSRLLRPAAGGVYVVSTGVESQAAVQRRLYATDDEIEIARKHKENLARIPEARGIVLGIPSDTGAGFLRGSNMGPQTIRMALLDERSDWPARADSAGIIDIGDVFVVPQLLHDDMLSEQQLAATRRALHPDLSDDEAAGLPVAPLSVAERVLDRVLAQNPKVAPFLIGGDHSCSWPAAAALHRARSDRWAIVQPDAHTDLLPERLGVKYCFATWSYHANEQFGRDGRMVQVGIRASGYAREHWESTLGVRQFWAQECLARPEQAIDELIAHLKEVGATGVYFSNDIDGTDSRYADATGTPEPDGLEPEWLLTLIRRLGAEVGLIGGDIMEVAPPLRHGADGPEKTTKLAAQYLLATMSAALQTEL